jgi:hypothetical protein
MFQSLFFAVALLIVAVTSGPSVGDVALRAVTAECGACN